MIPLKFILDFEIFWQVDFPTKLICKFTTFEFYDYPLKFCAVSHELGSNTRIMKSLWLNKAPMNIPD